MATLSSGVRLGPYEVIGRLGAGGMGEVWRAKDPRLGRDVAIKVLPELFAADPERLARFQREAQVLAALNHSNIAAIYGLEELGGTRALVLELVEGETLAQRIAGGPIPVDEALRLARQIAAALEVAHEQGIVHRDLKPANIIVTPAGVVKVLDFGLAKLTEVAPAAARGDLSQSPTLTSPALATNAGMLLGTAAYMSPEQARGRVADRRADMWAFGCVVYEMLTGQQTFAGETVTDVIAAVVTREPDLALLPAQTPATARWLLSRCLQKDPRERFRDAADAAALLDAPVTTVAPAAAAKTAATASKRPWAIAAVAGLIALGALAALALAYRGTRAPAVEPMAFQIDVAEAPLQQSIALSPDGRRLVYLARNDGQQTFWVRTLDDLTPRVIPGVTGVNTFSWPFWSPDSRYIAFATADGKLKKVDPNGGVVEVVADLGSQFGGGSWSSNGTILVAANDHGLRAVPVGGGPITDVTTREPHEVYHDCPWFLPDGQHFLFLAYSETKPETRAIYLGELGSQSRTRLIASNSCAVYASGHILATRESSLFAWPFDPQKLTVTGDAIPVAPNVSTFSGGEVGSFAASDTGVLIFRQGADEAANRRLVWFDRNGKAGEPTGPPIRTSNIQLSPDGNRVAYAEALDDGPADVWVYNFSSGAKIRLTTDRGMDHTPVWSHDGRRIFFDSHRNGDPVVYERVADGATPEQTLIPAEKTFGQSPRVATPDGRFLLFGKSATSGPPWSLWLQPLSLNGAATQYLPSKFDQATPAVSPDSRWVAYATDESGTSEIVVQPLINPSAGRWQVSINGGASPKWGRGGRELYYLARNGDLMAVPVTAGATFESGSAVRLFKTPLGATPGGTPYDVTRDGERFLLSIATRDPDAQPMTAVVNWPAKLKR
jgi:eukaryotic-like serine/threonine-protein kinase